NPFTIPPEIDIFSIRNEERKKAKAERERMKTMKIHEKMTYSAKIKAKQKGCRKALQKEEEEEARKEATNEERLKTLQETLSWKISTNKDNLLEKETFHDYINDRREIFLLEYAMTVKRDEIRKMENVAKIEERKLKKAEYYLEKDAAVFTEFLKENHKNSVQALKIAEKESTAKTKKIKEIQAITSQIEHLQSDISRFKNSLQKYKTYRDFLYELSPKEWQEEHRIKHTKEKDLKITSKATEEIQRKPTPHLHCEHTKTSFLLEQIQTSVESHQVCNVHNSLTRSPLSYHFSKGLIHKMLFFRNIPEGTESETCSDEDEEPELYFTDPQQLLSIFTEMEEENLSFIQNSQETEESLDKVQHTFITTHESTAEISRGVRGYRDVLFKITSFLFWPREKKLAELKQQVVTLKSSLAKKEERLADLKRKVHLFSSGEYEADDQDKMLKSLNKKVLEVYCHCTGENETNLQTVQMLMVIEKQLNDLLDNLERIPPAKVEQAKKAKNMERRMWLREEMLREQKQQQEERLQRALERSQ
ncbi:CP100 protein, partial [Arenaria interpres]|nr:CP100 protein [Arenaria interpres]